MDQHVVVFLVPIIISLGAFLMVWGMRYFENKENMALIERGLQPMKRRREADPNRTLKNALTFIGAGLGLLLAIFVTRSMGMVEGEATGVFFGLIAIFGGLGMLAAYMMEKKNPSRDEQP